MTACDVIVVGGGPAGVSCAYTLAKLGKAVVNKAGTITKYLAMSELKENTVNAPLLTVILRQIFLSSIN